jgi:hypothetical protein
MNIFKNETQESVHKWCEATFGPLDSLMRLATRANEELVELLEKVANLENTDYDDPSGDDWAAECIVAAADVIIVLCRLATVIGVDISEADLSGGGDYPLLETTKVFRHMASLLAGLSRDDRPGISGRVIPALSGVVNGIAKVAEVLSEDLGDAIDKKMAVNRSRKWQLDGSGQGYHVKEAT